MLANCRIHSTLPATDLERARRFYADKLGLTPEQEEPGGLLYHCGEGSLFLLYPSQGEASGTHTQAGWLTNDIEAEVADLKARGVVFEEYDTPALKTLKSIATVGPDKVAWFKDSEGNLLVLVQVQGNRI
jgi:catechol 2,3-dioxygenase-like lactoylglutathione lyase family enzyme